jgi:hypothetical protein
VLSELPVPLSSGLPLLVPLLARLLQVLLDLLLDAHGLLLASHELLDARVAGGQEGLLPGELILEGFDHLGFPHRLLQELLELV